MKWNVIFLTISSPSQYWVVSSSVYLHFTQTTIKINGHFYGVTIVGRLILHTIKNTKRMFITVILIEDSLTLWKLPLVGCLQFTLGSIFLFHGKLMQHLTRFATFTVFCQPKFPLWCSLITTTTITRLFVSVHNSNLVHHALSFTCCIACSWTELLIGYSSPSFPLPLRFDKLSQK